LYPAAPVAAVAERSVHRDVEMCLGLPFGSVTAGRVILYEECGPFLESALAVIVRGKTRFASIGDRPSG